MYKGEAWPVYHDDNHGNWVITNIGYTIRGIGLPMNGDNEVVVEIDEVEGGHAPKSFDFKPVPSADLKTQENIWPWITVRKGNSAVRIFMYTTMNSWPKTCHAAGLAF